MNNSQSVTAVITHQVRSGRETGYEEWLKGIAAAARQFEGHLGANILRPQPGATPNYIIVLQFESSAHLDTWLTSEVRNDWIERVQPLIQEQESIQVLTGLEAWFQLPQQSSSYKPPKHYKQAILVWVGVMIVSLLVSPLVAPLLAPLPWILRVAINVAITVSLLSYGIMPYLTRWFKGWLFDG
ncbi:MAG: antibiotic biosynthesis monooxygenase [Cyanobacteria bacterium J06634_6]